MPGTPWTPENLGASLLAYWDASDAPTTTWTDRIYGIALTASGSPTYNATGLNGAPTVEFSGSDNYGLSGSLPTVLPAGTEESWIWAVGRQDSGSGDTAVRNIGGYGNSSGTGAQRLLCKVRNSGANRIQVNRGGGGLIDTSFAFDSFFVFGGRFIAGGTTVGGRFNGADTSPATSSQSFSTGTSGQRVRIGADCLSTATSGTQFNGKISAFLITSALSPDQIEKIEGWAAWSFGP